MILSEYIPGNKCDPKKVYVELETYDKVLYALRGEREVKKIREPHYISCRTYRTYEEFIKYSQYAAGWNDAMKYIFGEDKT